MHPGRLHPADRPRDRPRQFKQVNDAVGLRRGEFDPADLVAPARSTAEAAGHAVARITGDEFALILLSEREPDRIIAFAETIRRAMRTPITFAEREIFLTASIGLALHDPQIASRREEVLKNAEIAMVHAKRHGGDRIEVFRPTMRSDRSDRLTMEAICAGRSTGAR